MKNKVKISLIILIIVTTLLSSFTTVYAGSELKGITDGMTLNNSRSWNR